MTRGRHVLALGVGLGLLLFGLTPRCARAQQVVDVQRATLLDAVGRTHVVHGGAWLDDAATLTIARELARKDAENAALRASPAPAWPWWLALGVGLAGGVAVGLALR